MDRFRIASDQLFAMHPPLHRHRDDRPRGVVRARWCRGAPTGNLEAAAHIKLHRARLNRFFSFGGDGSDSDDRGEATRIARQRAAFVCSVGVEAGRCMVIGDTPHDVDGAHAAGMACVGVASHHFDAEELRDAGADWVITSLTERLPL